MLTQSRLKELLYYCPETGVFTRRTSSGGCKKGTIAGYVGIDKRVNLYIKGKNYRAHRLAWLYVYGQWPVYDIDHIDGNPSNNRIDNLRDVPHQINQQNRIAPTRVCALQTIGVIRNKKRFGAQIKIDGKRVWLGTYDTPEEAHAVYLDHKRRFHIGNTL